MREHVIAFLFTLCLINPLLAQTKVSLNEYG